VTEEELQQAQRAFEKAKFAGGTQAMHDWAIEHAPKLFAAIAPASGEMAPEFQALCHLYPNVSVHHVLEHAASDIKALRADRAQRVGTALDSEIAPIAVHAAHDFSEALRPFAVMGAPATLKTIEEAAAAVNAEWDGSDIFTVRNLDGDLVATVSRDACVRAHELVEQLNSGTARSA
jgi:hypothetical protein